MGLKDIIRAKKIAIENQELKAKVNELESLLLPEHFQIFDLNETIKRLTEESEDLCETITIRQNKISELQKDIKQLNSWN